MDEIVFALTVEAYSLSNGKKYYFPALEMGAKVQGLSDQMQVIAF